MDSRKPKSTKRIEKALLCLAAATFMGGCTIEKFGPELYRGGEASAKLLPELKRMGIKTIISVRTNPKEKLAALFERNGIHYVQIPTGVFITPADKEFDKFFAIVNDPKQRPVYICCQTDRDRTGLYVSAYRALHEDVTYDELITDMKRHHCLDFWFWKYKYVIRDFVRQREKTRGEAGSP